MLKNKSTFLLFVLAFIFITFGLGLNLFYISKYKKDAIEYTKADLKNSLYILKHHIANENKLEYYLMKNIRYIITKSDMNRASYIVQKNFDNDNSLFLIIDKNLNVVGKGYKEDKLSIYEDAISNQNIKNAIYKCISSHKYCFTPAFKIDKHYFIFTLLPIKDSLYLLQIHKPPLYIYASSKTGFSYGVLLPNGVINAHIPILSKSHGEPKLAAITRLDLVAGKVVYPYVSASLPFVLKGYYTNLRAVFLPWFIFGVIILGFIAFIIKKTKNEYLLNQEKYFYEVLFDKYSLPLLLIDENGKNSKGK